MANLEKLAGWLFEQQARSGSQSHTAGNAAHIICADPKAFLDLLEDCGVVGSITYASGPKPVYFPIQPEPPHVHKWEPWCASVAGGKLWLKEACVQCPANGADTQHLYRDRVVDWPPE